MLELRLLRYFVAVAETEHLGRAAVRLHVSASPLSRQIRQLEESLGLELFARERQRLRLTKAGAWFLERAQRLLGQSAAVEEEAARYARGEEGSLRIGFVSSAMWTELLPRAIQRFRAARPEVTLQLSAARSPAQLIALRRGELDLGIVHVPPTDDALTSVTIAREPLCLAVPPKHPLARPRSRKRPVAPADLEGEPFIALGARGSREHAGLLALFSRIGLAPEVPVHASDQGTQLRFVAAGLGMALVPASAGAANSGVVLCPLPWLGASRSLFLVSRTGDTSPAARYFASGLAGER